MPTYHYTAVDVRRALERQSQARGGASVIARDLGVSRQQLQRFMAGADEAVPPKIAAALGLARQTTYVSGRPLG